MTSEPRREELLDLALGLLEPAEARALEAHAEGCADCRAELGALRETRRLVGGLPPFPAPERGAAVLLAAARQATEARKPRWALPRWLAGGALGLAGATALALLVLRGPAAPTSGPLSEDREALLGRAAPAAAPPAAPAAAQAAPAEIAAEETKAGPTTPVAPRPVAPAEKRAAPPPEERVAARDEAREASRAVADEQAAPARKAEAAIGGAGAGRVAPPAPPASSGVAAYREAPMAMRAQSAAPAEEAAPAKEAAAPCRLEQRRQLLRQGAGRLVGRVREGHYPAAGGEVALRVEERFGSDGRLLGATVRAGSRLYTVSEEDVAAGRLEPLPGVLLAPTIEAAERTPPRCEP
jgi:hypothetical protein